ncbi:hypothetical protein ACO2Q1_16310 [Brevundimonas sp. VNH65]|uniref:hypothetical protein n=1 Tax=Brevundimonas sp. VNH65 TaxID=3400917 RepID=UPI003BFC6C38
MKGNLRAVFPKEKPMFYPACAHCGGKTTSSEPSTRHANYAFNQWLKQQAAANHPHGYLKMAVLICNGGNEIYKRLPGGGEKRCTNCGHTFR